MSTPAKLEARACSNRYTFKSVAATKSKVSTLEMISLMSPRLSGLAETMSVLLRISTAMAMASRLAWPGILTSERPGRYMPC